MMNFLRPLVMSGLMSSVFCASDSGFCPLAHSAEAQRLFNGKDLSGWQGEGYTVADGVITCTPKGRNLMTEKSYSSYLLEFDFKLPPAGNNGLGIHYPGHGVPAHTGVEIQILDDSADRYKNLKPYQFHGGLYFLKGSRKGQLKPVGEWNHQKVTVKGEKVQVELNGVVINEADLSQLEIAHPEHKGVKRRAGHIALCGHGDPVQFKNIWLTELPVQRAIAANTGRTVADFSPLVLGRDIVGYTALYNGKDLSGWKKSAGHQGHWQPRGSILHYDGKSTARDKNLWTEKSYSDFVMICDWRWAAPASRQTVRPKLDPSTGEAKKGADGKAIRVKIDELDSGIYLRGNSKSQINLWNWPCGSGEVYGYRTDKKMPQAVRAALTPRLKADMPVGQWNRTVITMKGDRLTVELNGHKVIDHAQLPGVPRSGPIALQHHGSAIEFGNLLIKEL